MKYFFRDLEHEGNLLDGKTYHAAGIAELRSELGKPCPSGKDVSVVFLHPFTGQVYRAWRSFGEILLFESDNDAFEKMRKLFEAVEEDIFSK